ncbi:metal ABC transporter substrate-binding protein [Melissococcus plutonius]|nr:metal ABC transporter substrate-binding protein [Melissococcus plutonius]MCV2498748.1 metal ABC transporter substrate-binding protein [Melissococcus plutonius]MCV2501394.1 metal ABC transporter substrate-binding protein [Melissococcus plutonius]MCV2504972.1 metal ABC transporter substrate-binding protein [Melissococcus plutonius]MCV2507364.1 metal ABC transporter substrate-binding protein [Melissococcus plutonius]MCV2519794.1 metal ABC transporter substrate-binding protein [Melissococcus pl
MKKRHYALSLLLLCGITLLFTGCGSKKSENNEAHEKIKVVTTFYPMYDFTKNITGNEADVTLLTPAGTEPHDYEPSVKDLTKVYDADVFVYNNHEMETWVDKALESVDDQKTEVVEASKSISLMKGHKHDHDSEDHHNHQHEHEHDSKESEIDPHVWLDPVLAQKEVIAIRDALIKKFPKKKAIFTKNASNYLKKLKELDKEYKTAFSQAKNKTFVTQHAAFGYLAKQYGLTQESIAGISPDQEPSSNRLAELKHYINEKHISVIYFETSASSKVAKALANETHVSTAVLNPIESLTTKEQKTGKNYITIMQDNLNALQKSIK